MPVIFTDFASPGGGGSGGAILLQAPAISVAPTVGVLNVSGGKGGLGQGVEMIVNGGDGSPGLIRIAESTSGLTNQALNLSLAAFIRPFDSGAVNGDWDPDGDWVGPGNSVNWLSCAAGGFAESTFRPETQTGIVTCWYLVPGNFFSLNFDPDAGPNPEDKGWNMDIFYRGLTQGHLIPFRGDNGGLFGGNDFETEFGNEINTAADAVNAVSPVAVRFQGARLTGVLPDLCEIDLVGANVLFGSLTTWVDHPLKLNDATVQPNAIRISIIFDHAPEVGAVAADVRGVTNFRISASPD
jgi:hypothetical protein